MYQWSDPEVYQWCSGVRASGAVGYRPVVQWVQASGAAVYPDQYHRVPGTTRRRRTAPITPGTTTRATTVASVQHPCTPRRRAVVVSVPGFFVDRHIE